MCLARLCFMVLVFSFGLAFSWSFGSSDADQGLEAFPVSSALAAVSGDDGIGNGGDPFIEFLFADELSDAERAEHLFRRHELDGARVIIHGFPESLSGTILRITSWWFTRDHLAGLFSELAHVRDLNKRKRAIARKIKEVRSLIQSGIRSGLGSYAGGSDEGVRQVKRHQQVLREAVKHLRRLEAFLKRWHSRPGWGIRYGVPPIVVQ